MLVLVTDFQYYKKKIIKDNNVLLFIKVCLLHNHNKELHIQKSIHWSIMKPVP